MNADKPMQPVAPGSANWLDRAIAYIAPQRGVERVRARKAFAWIAGNGYDAAQPSTKRRFSLNARSGDALAQLAAGPMRNQARNLDRNHDIAKGALDRLVDFMVGPNGITIEPQPKRKDGSIHTEFAALLHTRHQKWAQLPEVTQMYDWVQVQRLSCRTWLRDGEVMAQLITGPRNDQPYGDPRIPVALEMLEPDFVPNGYDDYSQNIRQGIKRNGWGRPKSYFVYKQHPGDAGVFTSFGPFPAYADLKEIPAAQMLHVRLVDRFHQVRGISVMASVINRLQDIYEYQDFERIAAKMAASMVLKLTYGAPEMWGSIAGAISKPATREDLPIWQMDGGMVVSPPPGGDAEFFDTKRPNVNAVPFVQQELRHASAGFGLSYSSLSRNYDGSYAAQRQELVENRPAFEAGTMLLVAQLVRPTYETVVDWVALMEKIPADLDLDTLHDALYVGPPMIWIDPAREADARLAMVSAGFTSRSQVIRQLGQNPVDVDKQRQADNERDTAMGLVSSSNAATGVLPASPPAVVIEDPGQKGAGSDNAPANNGTTQGASVVDIRNHLRTRESARLADERQTEGSA